MNRLSAIAVAVASLCVGACASQPTTNREPRDPFERVNRATYAFNDRLDRAVLKPTAKAYRFVAPQFVETGVSNFMDNISYPQVFLNDVLQWKLNSALHDTGRFILNTTVGIGGLFDPATAAGLQKNDEDFGQTLGKWGLPSGPYLMLPFLGPATVRDGFGRGVDQFADPLTYVNDNGIRYGVGGLRLINFRAQLLDTEKALDGVYDRYAILRSVYLQRRDYLTKDGDVPEERLDEELMLEDEQAEPKKETPKP